LELDYLNILRKIIKKDIIKDKDMLLLFTTLFFVLFIMTLVEAVADIIWRVKNNKYIPAHKWWAPAIVGGVWFWFLMLYLQ